MTVLRRLPLAALTLLVVAVVVATALAPVARLLGGDVVVVRSGSMSPAVPVGAALLLEGVPGAAIEPGDVVTVGLRGDLYLTHRVVRLVDRDDGRWFELRGDANPAPDPALVPASALVGRVAVVAPAAGYVLSFLSTGPGRLALLSLGLLLVALARLARGTEPPTSADHGPRGRRAPGPLVAGILVALVVTGAVATTAALLTDTESVDATMTTGSW